MSREGVRKGRRRAALLAAFVGVAGVFLSLGAGSASAAATCVYDDVTDTATITLQNDTAVVSKGSLNHLNVNGVWCAPALINGDTNNNGVANILVVGNGDTDALVIDESGGMFEPGIISDADESLPSNVEGKNDVEFFLGGTPTINQQLGGVENLSILGNAAADTITIGYDSLFQASPDSEGSDFSALDIGDVYGIVNLNDDEDADVWLLLDIAYPSISVDGRGGDDVISGKGSHGTGPAHGIGDAFGSNGLILNGGAGNDHVQGGENDDVLIGGPGDDVIDGNGSDESPEDGSECSVAIDISTGQLEGLEEPWVTGDTVDYSGSTGPITVDLDPGEVQGLGSATGDGADVLQNIENVIGSPGNDTISGDNANNLLFGGAGDDTLAGDAGNDCEWGQDGNDTFNENEGTSQAQGGTGTNNGSDLMIGGAGLDDTITYSERSTRVVVYLEPLPTEADNDDPGCFDDIQENNTGLIHDGADLNGDGDSFDALDEQDCVFLDTENAITGSGNDVLFAAYTNNRADNEFTGGAGNDVEVAGAGNDIFHEGAAANGADDMDGGTGGDTCDYSGRSNAVSVSLDGVDNDGEAGEGDNCGGLAPGWLPYWFGIMFIEPRDAGGGFGGGDEGNPLSGQDVENVNGGSGNDQLVGSDAGNVLNGNAGNDALTGGGSTDTLNGGDGDDWMSGGAGNDALNGGGGINTADYSSSGSGGVGVNVNLTTGQASGDGNDTLSGVQNVNGSSFADALRGDAGNNVLNGRGGADAIQGAAGDDTINGGDGSDELSGGAGDDRVSGAGGADAVNGNAGNDRLGGGPGADSLQGGGGNDILSGNAGRDFMRGGRGSDRCNPGTPGFGRGDRAVGCER